MILLPLRPLSGALLCTLLTTASCATFALAPAESTALITEEAGKDGVEAPLEEGAQPALVNLSPLPERVPSLSKAQPTDEHVRSATAEPTEADTRVAEVASDEDADESADESSDDGSGEAEDHSAKPADAMLRYTTELSDEKLAELWSASPAQLGSISVGFTDAGRLVNPVRFPEGPGWVVVDPPRAWATQETSDALFAALSAVTALEPAACSASPIRVNHLSRQEGGWLRPHRSHQSGRDVDLSFYYGVGGSAHGAAARRDNFDLRRNWALIRALATLTDTEFVLVDRRVSNRIYDYALAQGEDPAWLKSLFRTGAAAFVRHAPRHRDHFHVRFYNARAQELGRRIHPLLPKGKPEERIAVHRIRSGDNLGAIALRYGTTIKSIQRANRLKGTSIRAGRTLVIPFARSCIDCPAPPQVVVAPRRMPPFTPPQFQGLYGVAPQPAISMR